MPQFDLPFAPMQLILIFMLRWTKIDSGMKRNNKHHVFSINLKQKEGERCNFFCTRRHREEKETDNFELTCQNKTKRQEAHERKSEKARKENEAKPYPFCSTNILT